MKKEIDEDPIVIYAPLSFNKKMLRKKVHIVICRIWYILLVFCCTIYHEL
jgi:hypothetical protein